MEVRFQGHYRLEGPGVIDARGTSPTQRDILFTAEDPTTGWYGIRIWSGNPVMGIPPDVSDYHLENCVIEYVVKDRSRPRPYPQPDFQYSDSRGALYIYGATTWYPGAPENHAGLKYSDVHLNGLMLRHNRALDMSSPQGMGGGLYIIQLAGGVEPVWTDVVFDDNQAVDYGGAFAMHHSGPVTFRGGAMTNNVATQPDQPGAGGAIGYWDVGGPVTLDHVAYSGNVPPGFATDEAPPVVVIPDPPAEAPSVEPSGIRRPSRSGGRPVRHSRHVSRARQAPARAPGPAARPGAAALGRQLRAGARGERQHPAGRPGLLALDGGAAHPPAARRPGAERRAGPSSAARSRCWSRSASSASATSTPWSTSGSARPPPPTPRSSTPPARPSSSPSARFLGAQRPRGRQAAGIALSLAGVLTIVARGDPPDPARPHLQPRRRLGAGRGALLGLLHGAAGAPPGRAPPAGPPDRAGGDRPRLDRALLRARGLARAPG